MKSIITLIKTSLFVFAITSSITLQAQDTTAVLHVQFEKDLTASGGFTFEVYDPGSLGVVIPYDSTNVPEGTYALNYTAIDSGSVEVSLIQNGDDADIRSTTNLGITGDSAHTVSAWIRYDDRNTSTNGSHCIVNLGDPASGSQGRNTFAFAAANNELQVGVGGGNIKHDYDPAVSTIEDGNWHHVAFTYPSGGTLDSVQFYIDGQPVMNTDGSNTTNTMNLTDDLVYVGSRGNNTQKWFDGGGIDDLRIYGYALSQEEMARVFAGASLSLEDVAFEKNEVKAYPNAVVDILHIETTSNRPLDINVLDMAGRVIIRTYGKTVDMSALSSGLYIVKVREDNKVANLKILKE